MEVPFQRVVSIVQVVPGAVAVIVIVPEPAPTVAVSACRAAASALGGDVALAVRATITPATEHAATAAAENPINRVRRERRRAVRCGGGGVAVICARSAS